MGYNSVLLVLNDALNSIEKDPQFGMKISRGISKTLCYPDEQIEIASGCCCPAATVIGCQHADMTQIVAVGGNIAIELGVLYGSKNKGPEDKVELIRQLANQYGYHLRRKPTSKTKK